jgi:hypothetical protein
MPILSIFAPLKLPSLSASPANGTAWEDVNESVNGLSTSNHVPLCFHRFIRSLFAILHFADADLTLLAGNQPEFQGKSFDFICSKSGGELPEVLAVDVIITCRGL